MRFCLIGTEFLNFFSERFQVFSTDLSNLKFRYTLFYENEKTSTPPMRPLWAEYPDDENTFSIQDQHLVGMY